MWRAALLPPGYRLKQSVGSCERGRMDRRTAVSLDESYWTGGGGTRTRMSESRKGKQRRVSSPGQHGMLMGSAAEPSPPPQGPKGPPVRTRGVRQTSQSFTATATKSG